MGAAWRLGMCALSTVVGCASGDRALSESSPCFEPDPPPAGLVLAGSGANLAPARRIARAYRENNPTRRAHVEPSIGTSGAVRALRDRAIDIGLASRPLRPGELDELEEHPLARVPLAFIVHERNDETGELTRSQLIEIYEGRKTTWPDGQHIVPLVRQAGDSTTRTIERSAPDLATAMRYGRASGIALTCYTDQEMRDALVAVPGALGILDAGTIRLEALPLRPLSFDGAPPSAADYPFALQLSLVTRRPATEPALHFVDFARSESVRDALAHAGYDVAARDGER